MKYNNIHIKLFFNIKIQTLTLGKNFSVCTIAFHYCVLKTFYLIEIQIIAL